MGIHDPGLIHGVQEQGGHRHLQHGLLQRGQAQIPVVANLGEVVQKADEAMAQPQHQHEKYRIVRHGREIAHKTQYGRKNEHEAAHDRGAGLVVMPGGADLPDGSAGLQGVQHRQKEMTQGPAQSAAHHTGNQNTCHKLSSVISTLSGTLPALFPGASHGWP